MTFTSRNWLISLMLRWLATLRSFANLPIPAAAEPSMSGQAGTGGEKSVDLPALLTPPSTSAARTGRAKNWWARNILGFRITAAAQRRFIMTDGW